MVVEVDKIRHGEEYTPGRDFGVRGESMAEGPGTVLYW